VLTAPKTLPCIFTILTAASWADSSGRRNTACFG
jgi:hypothetical protein